jgi:hypothetical protein
MPARRVNPNRVKMHRSYSVQELAACCEVHRNTVRHWQRQGLEPIDEGRPALFHGCSVRAFLAARNARRKRPCGPGSLYCLRCREPRRPAGGMVDYLPVREGSGNLRAICEGCEALMHRRVRKSEIAKVMPDCNVQFADAQPSLNGRNAPSLYCDKERQT